MTEPSASTELSLSQDLACGVIYMWLVIEVLAVAMVGVSMWERRIGMAWVWCGVGVWACATLWAFKVFPGVVKKWEKEKEDKP